MLYAHRLRQVSVDPVWYRCDLGIAFSLRNADPLIQKSRTQLRMILRWSWYLANAAIQNIPHVLNWVHVRRIWRPVQNINTLVVHEVDPDTHSVRTSVVMHTDHIAVVNGTRHKVLQYPEFDISQRIKCSLNKNTNGDLES